MSYADRNKVKIIIMNSISISNKNVYGLLSNIVLSDPLFNELQAFLSE